MVTTMITENHFTGIEGQVVKNYIRVKILACMCVRVCVETFRRVLLWSTPGCVYASSCEPNVAFMADIRSSGEAAMNDTVVLQTFFKISSLFSLSFPESYREKKAFVLVRN